MTTTEIIKMSKKIANTKGMTIKEYNWLHNKISTEWWKISQFKWNKDERKIGEMLYDTLVQMQWTLERNYFSQNRKFQDGDVVRYKDRLCKVIWGHLNMFGEILYDLEYANGKGMPRTITPFHENELTLVKAADMEDC